MNGMTKAERSAKWREYAIANKDRINARRRELRRTVNRERHREGQKRWRAAHPERARYFALKAHLNTRYGISIADYARMLEQQKGNCAICGGNRGTTRLAVDHDHASTVVRGLLCHKCNTGLGYFADSPDLLQAAIAYLQKRAVAA